MDVQPQLIAKEKLKRVQRLKYKNQQTKIFALWEDYVVDLTHGFKLLLLVLYILQLLSICFFFKFGNKLYFDYLVIHCN